MQKPNLLWIALLISYFPPGSNAHLYLKADPLTEKLLDFTVAEWASLKNTQPVN